VAGLFQSHRRRQDASPIPWQDDSFKRFWHEKGIVRELVFSVCNIVLGDRKLKILEDKLSGVVGDVLLDSC
jgi:hypothetical protein